MEKIDKLDKKILSILALNARIPFKDVAAECGVSRAAIHQRVQHLIEDGVITEDLMHISSLHAEIFWMPLNGMPEKRKIRKNTRSTIPVILRLRWNWHRIL